MLGLNCPYCGCAMAHQISQNDWHFYQCEACGPITLPPNGLIRRTQKSDHAAATERRRVLDGRSCLHGAGRQRRGAGMASEGADAISEG